MLAAMEKLLDQQGCLTATGFARLAGAAPGAAPPELAAHVAACSRCQRRLLAGPDAGFQPSAERKEAPPRWRILIVLAAVIALAIIAASLGRWLTTPAP
jgi:hypothetical protein